MYRSTASTIGAVGSQLSWQRHAPMPRPHLIGTNGSADHDAKAESIVFCAANMLSLVGDLVLLVCVIASRRQSLLKHRQLHGPRARRLQPQHFLGYFAIADIVGKLPVVGFGPGVDVTRRPALCSLQVFFVWYINWTSWLWLMAYAIVLREKVMLRSPRHEWPYHLTIWTVPACVVGLAIHFGGVPGDQVQFCAAVEGAGWMTALESLLAPILLLNVYVFISLQCYMRQAWQHSDRLLGSEESGRFRTNTQMGHLWLMYLAVFVVSQTPYLVMDELTNNLGIVTPTAAYLPLASLGMLHGFLNAVVFGCTQGWFRRSMRSLAASNGIIYEVGRWLHIERRTATLAEE